MADFDPMEAADAMNSTLRALSDMMKGAVKTLEDEGWTEAQAREIALAVYLSPFRKGLAG